MRRLPLPSCDRSAPWSAPLELADHAGRVHVLDVADGEVVAVVVDDEVRSVLLPARHCVHVLAPEETAGDLMPRELAERAGIPEAELRPWLGRLRHLPAEGWLLRLDTQPLPAMAWQAGGRGWWRAHVHSPARFYDSFLRHTESLAPERFAAITEAVVSETLAREDGSGDEPEDPSLARRAARGLRAIGMRLEEFERVEGDPWESPPARSSVSPERSPSLATDRPSG